jgi:AcrR family transcriptional regulator
LNTAFEIKNRLIAAAMDEFYEASFDQATMRSISKRTGFSLATVYKYFDSKQKLALDLGSQIIEKYNSEIELHLQGLQGTHNKIRKIAWYYFNRFQENEKEAWICYVTMATVYYEQLHDMQRLAVAQAESFEQILRDGQAAGEIRADLSIRTARAMFFGSLREFVTRWLHRKRLGEHTDLKYYFEPFINLYLGSIEVKPEPQVNCACPFISAKNGAIVRNRRSQKLVPVKNVTGRKRAPGKTSTF